MHGRIVLSLLEAFIAFMGLVFVKTLKFEVKKTYRARVAADPPSIDLDYLIRNHDHIRERVVRKSTKYCFQLQAIFVYKGPVTILEGTTQ